MTENIWLQAGLSASAQTQELTSEQGAATNETVTTSTSDTDAEQQAPPPRNPWLQMAPFFAVLIIIYFFMLRGPKKKQQEHQKMVQSLRKNDRVRTIGGILGTVIDIRGDDITLKIDESNNTKIHVIPGAIASVLSENDK